jgi:hypothetical protein
MQQAQNRQDNMACGYQTVAKTPPRIRESVALPVRGSEAPPVAEDTLHAKPKAKIKSKRKVSRDESQFLGW